MIVPLTLERALYVSRHMRDEDWRELSALRFSPTRERFAEEAMIAAQRGAALCVERNGRPVAIMGCALVHPTLATAWMWATDEFPRVAVEATKAALAILRATHEGGVVRIDALSHWENKRAHRWLRRALGFVQTALHEKYGADGADYILFTHWRDHVPTG